MKITAITSLNNRRFKDVLLLRGHRGRMKQRRFLIDGPRECGRAIDAGIEIVSVFYCEPLVDPTTIESLANHARCGRAEWFVVAPGLWNKLAYGERQDGIVAVASPPRRTLSGLSLGTVPLVVILDQVEKPGNIGAVLRSAHAFGADAVVITEGTKDLYNPNIIRASAGAIFYTPLLSANRRELQDWLSNLGLRTYVTRVDAAASSHDVDLSSAFALVLGNESRGLGSSWEISNATPLRIPITGSVGSLNVSISAAVILYEADRQRSRAEGR